MKTLFAALVALMLVQPAQAAAPACTGTNLIEALPQADREAIDRATAAVPHPRGLFWQARKDDARMLLIGTFHFHDPRHDPVVARFAADIASAAVLMVEAGPQEEQRLTGALAADPSLTVQIDGPTLPERLTPSQWAELSDALEARGVPPIIGSRLRPWYVATLLGVSPCMLDQAAQGGLDGLDSLLIDTAEKAGTPVRALEPWDTVFSLFEDLTPEDEIKMILAGLPAAALADDYAATLIESYFAGDVWRIWEFSRHDALANSGMPAAEVEEMLAETQERLMNGRNRSWIAPLTGAAQDAAAGGRGIVAAFGALHLPGEQGVLRLLEDEGWTVAPLEP